MWAKCFASVAQWWTVGNDGGPQWEEKDIEELMGHMSIQACLCTGLAQRCQTRAALLADRGREVTPLLQNLMAIIGKSILSQT